MNREADAAGAAILEAAGSIPHYSLLIEWDDEDRIYIATVPELPGCQTHGATYAEAAAKAADLIGEWVAVLRDSGLPVPAARHWEPSAA